MKVVCCGSRDLSDFATVCEAIRESGFEISEVFVGDCRGADAMFIKWAQTHGVPYRKYEADWNDIAHPKAYVRIRADGSAYNAAAGPIRNEKMVADAANECIEGGGWIGLPIGISKGTRGCGKLAEKYGLKTFTKEC